MTIEEKKRRGSPFSSDNSYVKIKEEMRRERRKRKFREEEKRREERKFTKRRKLERERRRENKRRKKERRSERRKELEEGKKRSKKPISRNRLENLVNWENEEKEEEATFSGENKDLRNIRESIMLDLLGIYKEEKDENVELTKIREELKALFRRNNPQDKEYMNETKETNTDDHREEENKEEKNTVCGEERH